MRCKKHLFGHRNRKRCKPCAAYIRMRPQGTMTDEQKAKAIKLIGKIPREKIAEKFGVTVVNLKRSLRGHSLWFKNGKYKNNPDLVREVINYYFKHGKPATVKRFPKINVKCIVDRPEYYGIKRKFRQLRWTNKEIIEAAKMAGIVSPTAQAKYFNRPGANAGSIKSLWSKRFNLGCGNINGMNHWKAKHLVTKKAKYIKTFGLSRKGERVKFIKIILWIDMEKNLKNGVPDWIANSIHELANFQRWMHGSENTKQKILQMIRSREL